jgi:hypothetical protein
MCLGGVGAAGFSPQGDRSGVLVRSRYALCVLPRHRQWYGGTTKVNPWRVLYANETIEHGRRPARRVFEATASLVAVFILPRRGLHRSPADANITAAPPRAGLIV